MKNNLKLLKMIMAKGPLNFIEKIKNILKIFFKILIFILMIIGIDPKYSPKCKMIKIIVDKKINLQIIVLKKKNYNILLKNQGGK